MYRLLLTITQATVFPFILFFQLVKKPFFDFFEFLLKSFGKKSFLRPGETDNFK